MINGKFLKILLIILLQFFLLSGFWAVDVGISGMMWEVAYGSQGQATSLGFLRTPSNQYHLGLMIVYIVFFINIAWLLYVILKKDGD